MKILIVDDSPSSLAVLEAMVGLLPGCEALPFLDSAAALAWCGGNEADLILVDYQMPPPDGLEFIRVLRRDLGRQDVPVVMVTSCESRDLRREALWLGASDFLIKPVDESEFLARVRNLLKLHQAHRTLEHRAQSLAEAVDKATRALIEREREAVLVLSRAAEHRDPETGNHLLRMATYSRLIAAAMGLPAAEVEFIYAAAPMHDVGKIGIPDRILLKPDRLDDEEFTIMKQHTVYGYEILAGSSSPLLGMAAEIALSHHERFDGVGYPRRLKGHDIPLVGRIVAVADVFDALSSERPYKKAWPLDKAMDYLWENRGSHFDPDCVTAFQASWDEAQRVARRYRE